MNTKTKRILALSIIPQIVLVKWLGNHPEWVETYYAQGIYPYISQFLRVLFGWIPFSVGDLFYTLLIFSAIRYLYLHGRSILKRPITFLTHLGIVLSIAYFIFHFLWGLNYYRLPLEEKLGMEKEYTLADLEVFTTYLVHQANQSQVAITKDVSEAVQVPYTRAEIFEKSIFAYREIEHTYPSFAYRNPSIKKSLYSLALTYMGYGGYLNPFTGEAQVNGKIPIVRYPTVSTHEIGHQVGYSSEAATNFLGFLISAKNTDPYFRYAGYSHALAYCLSDLRRKDPSKFNILWEEVNVGVKKNYQEIRKFWERYENPTEPIFKSIFNAYLKANSQKEGIQSYNRVVGLLVNYHKQYNF